MDNWDERGTLTEKYEAEQEHSAFLERLLSILYGNGWEHITMADARKWHKKHFKGNTNG